MNNLPPNDMEQASTLDAEAERDFQHFRELPQEHVESRKRNFRESAQEDWIVQCYDNVVTFLRMYPTPSKRKKLLDHFERTDTLIEKASQMLQEQIEELGWFKEEYED